MQRLVTRDLGNNFEQQDLSEDDIDIDMLFEEDGKEDEQVYEKETLLPNQQNELENEKEWDYWPMEQRKSILEKYSRMSYCSRNIKLLAIKDKELFVLTGNIDNYIYLLF